MVIVIGTAAQATNMYEKRSKSGLFFRRKDVKTSKWTSKVKLTKSFFEDRIARSKQTQNLDAGRHDPEEGPHKRTS